MDHRRHVELDHLLVDRVPPAVGQRRRVPVAARRIGVEVAADEAELVDAALQLGDAAPAVDAGRLRQLAHADEVLREQLADAVDQVVADARPRRLLVSESPMWCAMPLARGEKIVRSVPRSRCSLSWRSRSTRGSRRR